MLNLYQLFVHLVMLIDITFMKKTTLLYDDTHFFLNIVIVFFVFGVSKLNFMSTYEKILYNDNIIWLQSFFIYSCTFSQHI
jgi:hypothetical protein